MTTANVTLPLDLPSVHSCGQHNSDEEKVDEDVLKGCIKREYWGVLKAIVELY